jgi:hypothetical protein
MSGLIGGAAITWFDRHALGLVGAAFIAAALLVAEWAHRRIAQPDRELVPRRRTSSAIAGNR